jgi:hypothetical protein
VDLRRLVRLDWDAIAGIIAATVALVLHFLHVISIDLLITIAVVLIALLFIRNLRREHVTDQIQADLHSVASGVLSLQSALKPRDTVLVGPGSLSPESTRFAEDARGEMVWFHVCLSMFRPQALFDILLGPAITNANVDAIQFILDPGQRELWRTEVQPKVAACANPEKIKPPVWVAIDESVSVILSDAASPGRTRALLSFWGEPFMATVSGRDIPRYIFLLEHESELIPRLVDLARDYRLRPSDSS